MYIFWGLEVLIPGFFWVGKFIYLFIYLFTSICQFLAWSLQQHYTGPLQSLPP